MAVKTYVIGIWNGNIDRIIIKNITNLKTQLILKSYKNTDNIKYVNVFNDKIMRNNKIY